MINQSTNEQIKVKRGVPIMSMIMTKYKDKNYLKPNFHSL